MYIFFKKKLASILHSFESKGWYFLFYMAVPCYPYLVMIGVLEFPFCFVLKGFFLNLERICKYFFKWNQTSWLRFFIPLSLKDNISYTMRLFHIILGSYLFGTFKFSQKGSSLLRLSFLVFLIIFTKTTTFFYKFVRRFTSNIY